MQNKIIVALMCLLISLKCYPIPNKKDLTYIQKYTVVSLYKSDDTAHYFLSFQVNYWIPPYNDIFVGTRVISTYSLYFEQFELNGIRIPYNEISILTKDNKFESFYLKNSLSSYASIRKINQVFIYYRIKVPKDKIINVTIDETYVKSNESFDENLKSKSVRWAILLQSEISDYMPLAVDNSLKFKTYAIFNHENSNISKNFHNFPIICCEGESRINDSIDFLRIQNFAFAKKAAFGESSNSLSIKVLDNDNVEVIVRETQYKIIESNLSFHYYPFPDSAKFVTRPEINIKIDGKSLGIRYCHTKEFLDIFNKRIPQYGAIWSLEKDSLNKADHLMLMYNSNYKQTAEIEIKYRFTPDICIKRKNIFSAIFEYRPIYPLTLYDDYNINITVPEGTIIKNLSKSLKKININENEMSIFLKNTEDFPDKIEFTFELKSKKFFELLKYINIIIFFLFLILSILYFSVSKVNAFIIKYKKEAYSSLIQLITLLIIGFLLPENIWEGMIYTFVIPPLVLIIIFELIVWIRK